jgi:hypothetical protein
MTGERLGEFRFVVAKAAPTPEDRWWEPDSVGLGLDP